MKITRQAGIFPITFDTEKADFEARVNYNKLGFLADIIIDVNDTLTETNVYKQGIKLHAKGLVKELEKVVDVHYKSYHNFGTVDDTNMHSLNIYQISAKAYAEAFKFFTERSPSDICSIMEIIRQAESKGLNLQDINIEYDPVKL